MDSSHVNGAHEIFYTLSVNREVSENQIDVVVERAYGDDPNYAWRGTSNSIRTDTYAHQHSPGWTAEGTGIVASIILDPSVFPVTYLVPQLNGSHFDLVSGSIPGTVTSASGYLPGPADDVVDASIGAYATSAAVTHNSNPLWSSDSTSWSALAQSYPGKRNIFSQTPVAEQVWKSDWAAPNISSGSGVNFSDQTGSTRTLTRYPGSCGRCSLLRHQSISRLRRSSQRRSPTTTSPIRAALEPGVKRTALPAMPTMLASVLADLRKVTFTLPQPHCKPLQTTAPAAQCITNDATVGAPCGFGLWPGMGWALQVRQTPIDLNATGVRRLTQGFWPGMGQYYASNWIPSPEAKWGYFAKNPVGQRPKANDGGSDFLSR